MRKVLTILALAMLFVAMTVDPGQSKSRPYEITDITNGSGGSTDDHPWGGDDTGGGTGTNGGTITNRPSISAATGIFVVDYFANRFLQHFISKRWERPSIPTGETTTSTGNTPTSTKTQAN